MSAGSKPRHLVSTEEMKKVKEHHYRQRLPEKLNDRLLELAEERGQSKNQLVVDILEAFVTLRDEAKEELRRRLAGWI